MVFLRERRTGRRRLKPDLRFDESIRQNRLKIIVFEYTWIITDFWHMYSLLLTFNSSHRKKQPFSFRIEIAEEEDKLKIYAVFPHKQRKQRAFSYFIFLQTAESQEFCKMGFEWYVENEVYLYEIHGSDLREDKYVLNGELAIFFRCNIFNNVLWKPISASKSEDHNKITEQ